jgi:hypothetical protein
MGRRWCRPGTTDFVRRRPAGPRSPGADVRCAAWCNAEHCLPLDDVVRREVWDGSIPIRLELAKQDVSTFEPPMPFYLQAPRMAYLPLALAAAKAYFANYVPSVSCTDREMWVEYKNVPLRWHLPTGVLFDLFAHGDELPWGLTLHFSGVEAKVPCCAVQRCACAGVLQRADGLRLPRRRCCHMKTSPASSDTSARHGHARAHAKRCAAARPPAWVWPAAGASMP